MRATKFTKRFTSLIVTLLITVGCGGYSSLPTSTSEGNEPQDNEPSDNVPPDDTLRGIEALIGTVSLTYQFSDTSDEFKDILTFSNEDIFVDADRVGRLQRQDGYVATACDFLAASGMYQCTIAKSVPVGDSRLATYHYTGLRSGRGWEVDGAITLDSGVFGTTIEDLNNTLVDWRFSWTDGNETFGVNTSTGTIHKTSIELSDSGKIGGYFICASSINFVDESESCRIGSAAPYLEIRNQRWRASTVGSQNGQADARSGGWWGPRHTDAELEVTAFLFDLSAENTGSGVFEYCTGQINSSSDPRVFADECTLAQTVGPDGSLQVSVENDVQIASQPALQAHRLVAGTPIEGDGISDYKLVYDQATGNAVDYPLNDVLEFGQISRVISDSIRQSLIKR